MITYLTTPYASGGGVGRERIADIVSSNTAQGTGHSAGGTPTEWDVIVIGSGLGGLTCAAYLATSGKRVLVLEQGSTIGGNSQVFRRFNKYEFDVGLHYIGDCEPDGEIPTILRGVGLEGRVEFDPMDPHGFSTIVTPEFEFKVPRGWDEYLARLSERFPDERKGLTRCVRILRKIGSVVSSGDVPHNARGVVRLAVKSPAFAIWSMLPLTWLFKYCRLSEQAQATITAEAGDYATPPSRTPVAMHAAIGQHYLKAGAYYPRGGGHVIAANLLDVIQTHGGVARTQAVVERIDVVNGRVCGVTLADRRSFTAPVVVSNADIKRTYLELVGEQHLNAATVKRVRNYRMAPALFCVYLAVDIDLRERFGATQWFLMPRDDPQWRDRPATALERMYREAAAGRLDDSTELPVYVTSASLKDRTSPNHAPSGHSTLELMTVAPSQPGYWGIESAEGTWADLPYSKSERYRAVKDALTERMIERALEVIPDLREHIVWQEAATPITQERYTRSTGGTSYGIELAVDQFGPRRPLPRTEIEGLFLTGASTRSGHGIVGAMSGGVATASSVLRRNLLGEVRANAVFGDPSRLTAGGPDWDPLMACRRHADKQARAEQARERGPDRRERVPA